MILVYYLPPKCCYMMVIGPPCKDAHVSHQIVVSTTTRQRVVVLGNTPTNESERYLQTTPFMQHRTD